MEKLSEKDAGIAEGEQGMSLLDIRDGLARLDTYMDVLYKTHLDIASEYPEANDVIMQDYIEKSKKLLCEIRAEAEALGGTEAN